MPRFTDITQKSKEYWYVGALSQSSRGMPAPDEEDNLNVLCKRLGGHCTGGGTDLQTGQRDYSYAFPTKEAATTFIMRAVNARLIKNKVALHRYRLDWVPVGESQFASYKKVCK